MMDKFHLLFILSSVLPFAFARPWKISDPCPTTIRTSISRDPCKFDDFHECPEDKVQYGSMNAVHNVLTHCPDVELLDIWIGAQGCSSFPDRYTFPFSLLDTERFPALKSLKLSGYRFGERAVDGIREPESSCPSFMRRLCKAWNGQQPLPINDKWNKTSYELWRETMDWSQIEELSIEDSDIPNKMLKELPLELKSLKKISMTNVTFINNLKNNTLTHLTWVGFASDHILPSILPHQGQSLTHLTFRCDEITCMNFTTQFDLSILPRMAPNLKHIALNIPRNGTWPFKALRIIASLPRLETADIFFNIQSACVVARQRSSTRWQNYNETNACKGQNQYQRPFLTDQAALEMYRYMRQVKVGDKLNGNVTFHVGDFSPQDGGSIYSTRWMEGQYEKIICERAGKGEGEAWCKNSMTNSYWLYDYDYEEDTHWSDADSW